MVELLGIPYSPWTEKARWALDVRRVPYDFRMYAPLLGEPALRLKLGVWAGPVSVPVLTVDRAQVIAESAKIARWADRHGEGDLLFPEAHLTAIERFVELSEKGLSAGRALSLARVLGDDEALRELVPRFLRRPLGPIAARVAAMGVKRTVWKYGGHRHERRDHEQVLIAVLDELRAALARSPSAENPKPLLGRFTFADIAMAQTLAFVEPPAFGIRLGKGNRRNFTDDVLRARFADLVAWRDALYEKYRPNA